MNELIHGDCYEHIERLAGEYDALVSDPPYGIDWDPNSYRFTGGTAPKANRRIEGDDAPFDPRPFLGVDRTALFGWNHFSKHVPAGATLVWLKKRESAEGKWLSDAELIWLSRGRGIYVIRHEWDGYKRETERGVSLHPTQKPVSVIKEILGRLKVKPGETVLDPFMGSGSTGVACAELGMNFIGIEKDERYFKIAEQRCAQGMLF